MQYDVYLNPNPGMRESYPYLVDVQSQLLSGLSTRMMVPLVRANTVFQGIPKRLTPVLDVKGEMLTLVPFEAAAMQMRHLKKAIASVQHAAAEITDAMDVVLSGV